MQMKSIRLATLIALFASSTAFFISYLLTLSPVTRVLAQSTENNKNESDRLLDLCRADLKKNDFQAALQSCQKAVIIAQATREYSTQAKSLINLGLAYQNTRNLHQAVSHYKRALGIAREIRDRQQEAKSLGNLGLAYDNLGNYKQAIYYYNQQLPIVRAIVDRQQEAKSLGNLGLAYDNLRKYKQAIEYHSQSLTIARAIGDRQQETKSLINLGVDYDNLGNYKQAIEFHNQSLKIATDIGDGSRRAKSFSNLGAAYYALGSYKQAIDFYSKSLEISRNMRNKPGQAASLGNLGLACDNLGHHEGAIEYHNQSLTIARDIKDKFTEAASLGNLGLAYDSLRQYEQAIEYHKQSLTIASDIGDSAREANSLGNLGNAYYSSGDYQRAIDYHTKQLEIVRKIGDRVGQANSLNNIGLAHLDSGHPKASEENLREAIAVFESLRKDLGSNDAFKVSMFETQAISYRLLQKALVAQNRTQEALLIAERGRAKALIELLTQRQQLSNKPVPPSLEQIQQIAKQQNSTLVEYSVARDDLYIWVVKPTGDVTFEKVDIKKTIKNTSLAHAAEDTRVAASAQAEGRGVGDTEIKGLVDVDKTCSTRRKTNSTIPQARPLSCRGNNCLQQMYQLLIQPIEKQLPTNPDSSVIFIPHESLFLVPFAALQDQKGNFLIEKHTISIAPSIQVLELIHQQKLKLQPPSSTVEKSLGDALIVGNPTMPKVPPRIGEPPQPLEALPGAQKEANTIAQLLKTQALTGKQATLAIVKQRMQKARIIHLATHGLLDDLGDAQIIPGKVALAPSKGDDGLLSANEVLKLKLNASLVVLSACDTGWGRITGDGVIGLPRAFITAGVPSIVVSLWRVPDQSTAFLMPEFYRQLQHNRDKAHALRQAMLSTMKKYPNPSDWAAFVFIGEAD